MSNDKLETLTMKQKSAKEALKFVQNDMILGIGSGSTVKEFITLLRSSKLNCTTLTCIPSSYDTEYMLIENKLKIGILNQYPQLDLTIDGADRVDNKLNVIKGGGGALLREKIIASAAKEVLIMIDDTKVVSNFDGSFPIPVEVMPHAKEFVIRKLVDLGGKPFVRKASDKLGPTITDNGNIILDTAFSEIINPSELEKLLNNIPGVMENGLFPNRLINKVIIASASEIKIREK